MANQIAVFIDFENVALWAEQEFIDFELTPLMTFLQTRGPVVMMHWKPPSHETRSPPSPLSPGIAILVHWYKSCANMGVIRWALGPDRLHIRY